MPRKVPSEYTGRFSIKRKRSTKASSSATPRSQSQAQTAQSSTATDPPLTTASTTPTEGATATTTTAGTSSAFSTSPARKPELQLPRLHLDSPPSGPEVDYFRSHKSQGKQPAREPGQVPTTYEKENDTKLLRPAEDLTVLISSAYRDESRSRHPDARYLAQVLAVGFERIETGSISSYVADLITSLQQYAYEAPSSIDFLLGVLAEATRVFQKMASTRDGRAAAADLAQFHTWIRDAAFPADEKNKSSEMDTSTSDPIASSGSTAKLPPILDFSALLARARERQAQRQEQLVSVALCGRAIALGILPASHHAHAESAISSGLAQGSGRQDFISSCILLRSSAHSILAATPLQEAQLKKERWQQSLESFVLQAHDDDGGVYAHAVMAHHVLVQRERDETSEEVFRLQDWIH